MSELRLQCSGQHFSPSWLPNCSLLLRLLLCSLKYNFLSSGCFIIFDSLFVLMNSWINLRLHLNRYRSSLWIGIADINRCLRWNELIRDDTVLGTALSFCHQLGPWLFWILKLSTHPKAKIPVRFVDILVIVYPCHIWLKCALCFPESEF